MELFGYREYVYIYVDQYNAQKCFSEYLSEHEDKYTDIDVEEKDGTTVL